MARAKDTEFNQIEYQNEFKRGKYDRMELVMAKGKKAIIKNSAMAAGQSMSEYINQAIDERMEREKE